MFNFFSKESFFMFGLSSLAFEKCYARENMVSGDLPGTTM